MADHVQEQEMEIEALEAILMDDFKEIHSSESGLNTSKRCFQITLSPQDDEADESTTPPVEMALIFAHTEKYPDEPPLLNLKSLRGIQSGDLAILKEKLEQESRACPLFSVQNQLILSSNHTCLFIVQASENLGMAMVYTLVTSAKEWLSAKFSQDAGMENNEEEGSLQDDIVIPHGEAVTIDTFLAWRERFEAELALEKAKLMPETALAAPKERKLTGREWFESGRASGRGAVQITKGSEEEDEEEIDFDDDDFEDDDEEDMLEHYLAEKSNSSTSSSRPN